MRRRKALKLITLGIVGTAMVHPKSRRKIIRVGKQAVDLYERSCIELSRKKKISEKNMAELRPVFNFASKKEEREFEIEILTALQERRLKEREFWPQRISREEMQKQIVKLTKKRRVFAHNYLTKANFKGKKFSRADVGRSLINYFEENERIGQVPSETAIKDMVDTGATYNFK